MIPEQERRGSNLATDLESRLEALKRFEAKIAGGPREQVPSFHKRKRGRPSSASTIRIRPPEPPSSVFDRTVDLSRTCCLPCPGFASAQGPPLQWAAAALVYRWLRPRGGKRPLLEGRFRLEELLAFGGMSCVYEGRDLKSGRQVAIKVVPSPASDLVRDSLEVTRPLHHPNVLSVDHHGSLPEGLYLVMPLLQGRDLGSLLFAPGGAREALLIALRDACEGVAHAHSLGVVHRDLKPANIRVEPDGRTLVMDWGLACSVDRQPEPPGRILGTPLYMAPEQVDQSAVSPRTDVYALGVILYEALTGVHPAGRDREVTEVFHSIHNETPPPPSLLRRDLPRGLDAIVLRALRKDPAERFCHAGELLEALDGL